MPIKLTPTSDEINVFWHDHDYVKKWEGAKKLFIGALPFFWQIFDKQLRIKVKNRINA